MVANTYRVYYSSSTVNEKQRKMTRKTGIDKKEITLRFSSCNLTKITYLCVLCAFSAYRHAEMSKRNLLQLSKKRQARGKCLKK